MFKDSHRRFCCFTSTPKFADLFTTPNIKQAKKKQIFKNSIIFLQFFAIFGHILGRWWSKMCKIWPKKPKRNESKLNKKTFNLMEHDVQTRKSSWFQKKYNQKLKTPQRENANKKCTETQKKHCVSLQCIWKKNWLGRCKHTSPAVTRTASMDSERKIPVWSGVESWMATGSRGTA